MDIAAILKQIEPLLKPLIQQEASQLLQAVIGPALDGFAEKITQPELAVVMKDGMPAFKLMIADLVALELAKLA